MDTLQCETASETVSEAEQVQWHKPVESKTLTMIIIFINIMATTSVEWCGGKLVYQVFLIALSRCTDVFVKIRESMYAFNVY